MVLFPDGQISEVQRRFMTTAEADNVRCVAVDGSFDDCQAIVKALFADEAFRTAVDLSGVNSINWARIAAQAVYYFTSAVALGAPDRAVAFAVPTGNFGDAFAGYAAMRMGLPVAGIAVRHQRQRHPGPRPRPAAATPAARSWRPPRPPWTSRSPPTSSAWSSKPLGPRRRRHRRLLRRLRRCGRRGAARSGLAAEIAAAFTGVSIDEATVRATIRETWTGAGVLIDPHTAVGVAAARRHPAPPGSPQVVLSTAHPAKFPDAVEEATGEPAAAHARAAALATKVERIDRAPAEVAAVRAYVEAFVRG